MLLICVYFLILSITDFFPDIKNVFLVSYFKDKERTIESMDKGYFKTGDMGKFDEDGWLYVSGRIEDLIQYDTWSLIPTDIEDCISSHEKVKDAVVIGNNKDVVAMVQKVPESPLTAKEIQM